MCMVSFVGAGAAQSIQQYSWIQSIPSVPPSREEFETLKREVQELKKVLVAAKEYDDATGQPDCEMEEKVERRPQRSLLNTK